MKSRRDGIKKIRTLWAKHTKHMSSLIFHAPDDNFSVKKRHEEILMDICGMAGVGIGERDRKETIISNIMDKKVS